MDADFAARLDGSRDYTELFRLVKRLVEQRLRKSRAGIMLGLAPLGLSPSGFFGGYFVVGSNAIVLNRDVLNYIKLKEPAWHNAYAFHVLLHEYLHTLGYFSEDEVRPMAHQLSVDALGPDHPATRIAAALRGWGSREAREAPTQDGASADASEMVPGESGETPAFFRELVFPKFGYARDGSADPSGPQRARGALRAPSRRPAIEIVKGFDPDATSYIG